MRRSGKRSDGPFYGWVIAATCFSIYFFTNGLALFVPQNLFPRYMETFGASPGEVSRTTFLTLGIAAFIAPLIGAIVDRIGVVRVIRTGLIVMSICLAFYPFARTLNDLYLLHAGLALGLVLSGLMANVVLLSNWFVRRRGAVVGMLAAGSSLAGGILPLMIAPLVTNPELGWRYGYGALVVGFWLFALLPGLTLLRERPADMGTHPDGQPMAAGGSGPAKSSEHALNEGVNFSVALKSPALYFLALGSACLWYSIQAMNSQVTIFLEEEGGMAAARATLIFALIFWCSFLGKFSFGWLSDRLAKRTVMQITSSILLAGCMLLFDFSGGEVSLTTTPWKLWTFAVVFGLGFGGSFTMIQLVAVETFGKKALGKVLGIITFIDSLGAAAGTIISGQLRTETGSYLIPFAIITVVALIALANVLLIRPVRPTPGAAKV